MKDRNYPIGQRKCDHCGELIEIYSNAQKYCSREDSPECDDDRYYSKLWKQGKHPLQKTQLKIMKKELKDCLHLYLGRECKTTGGKFGKLVSVGLSGSIIVYDNEDPRGRFIMSEALIPILRPLSDMTLQEARELFDVGLAPEFAASIIKEISASLHGLYKRISLMGDFDTIPKLLKMGFDIFGLIEAGLAIDKTTIK